MALISGPTVDAAISDPNNELAKLAAGDWTTRQLVDELFLRILNRPATPQEIEGRAGRAADAARRAPAAGRANCSSANSNWRRHRPAGAGSGRRPSRRRPANWRLTKSKSRRRKRNWTGSTPSGIAEAEAALKEYEAQMPQRFAAWEQQAKQPAAWTPLDPVELSSTNGRPTGQTGRLVGLGHRAQRQDDLQVRGPHRTAGRDRRQAGSAGRRPPALKGPGPRPQRQLRADGVPRRVGPGSRAGEEDTGGLAERPSRLQPGRL